MITIKDGIIHPFVDENYYQLGINKWIQWDMEKDGYRILLSGPSGSGKTTAAQLILSKIALHVNNCSIYVLDYKNIDFAYLEGCKNYFKFNSTTDGFLKVYDLFESRLEHNKEYSYLVLYIDEYPSWILVFQANNRKTFKERWQEFLILAVRKIYM